MKPRASIVIPVYNEGAEITTCLNRILGEVELPVEVLCVYDCHEDTTVEYIEKYSSNDDRVRGVLNGLGQGPAFAIRAGFDAAEAPVAVVTMADGSDDPSVIDDLVKLVERGVSVAAASRYMAGGAQVGGPFIKGLISRMAGLTLFHFARVGTRDATNSFKAYSVPFLRAAKVDSTVGFTVGIELVAKARRMRLPVAEIPTIWLDRVNGQSSFKTREWLGAYFNWYKRAFGPRVPVANRAEIMAGVER